MYGDGGGFFGVLRDFLYRLGFRETHQLEDPSELAEHMVRKVWPIVFIDGGADDLNDGFSLFDNFYGRMGYELLSFVFVAPAEDRRYPAFVRSLGARGFLCKPLQPAEANLFLKDLRPNPGDALVVRALDVAKMTFAGNFEGAQSILEKLVANPFFERSAEVALLRCESVTGQFSKAEDRLAKLLKRYPDDLRIQLEAADYYRRTSQHSVALQHLKRVETTRLLPHRMWEQVCLNIEIDEIDAAALLLNEMYVKIPALRDVAVGGIARMMLFMGMSEYLSTMLKGYPQIGKMFNNYALKAKSKDKGPTLRG